MHTTGSATAAHPSSPGTRHPARRAPSHATQAGLSEAPVGSCPRAPRRARELEGDPNGDRLRPGWEAQPPELGDQTTVDLRAPERRTERARAAHASVRFDGQEDDGRSPDSGRRVHHPLVARAERVTRALDHREHLAWSTYPGKLGVLPVLGVDGGHRHQGERDREHPSSHVLRRHPNRVQTQRARSNARRSTLEPASSGGGRGRMNALSTLSEYVLRNRQGRRS